jgi:hypothetical protein
MQVRRPTVWITFLVFTALLFFLLNRGQESLNVVLPYAVAHESLPAVIAGWAFNVNTYLPLCVGALLANRLPRDRRTRVDEIFTTLPTPLGTRLVGKYLGSVVATALPMFVVYLAGVGYITALSRNLLAIPLALETFLVIALPGLLFVGAFSIAVPALLWVPIYQFLFIGYWYWNTLWFHADIPNLSRTLLSPVGLFMAMGIYGLSESSSGPQHPISISGTAAQGVASILLLIGIAIATLFALDRYLHWRQVRQ